MLRVGSRSDPMSSMMESGVICPPAALILPRKSRMLVPPRASPESARGRWRSTLSPLETHPSPAPTFTSRSLTSPKIDKQLR